MGFCALWRGCRVFFSSCNSVKFHSELLNYIDIPVLISTIRDRVGFGYPWQAEAAAKNADLLWVLQCQGIRFSLLLTPSRRVYCFVQMSLLVVWIFPMWTGLSSTTLPTTPRYVPGRSFLYLDRNTFIVSDVPPEAPRVVVAPSSSSFLKYGLPRWPMTIGTGLLEVFEGTQSHFEWIWVPRE